MAAQHVKAFGGHRVVGGDQAANASGSQIFRGEKTEAAVVAKGAREAIAVARTDSLGSVFDDDEIIGAGNGQDEIHVGWQAEEVYGHNRAGVGSDDSFEQCGVEIESDRINVNKHG